MKRFEGNAVLDSENMAFRDENDILDQIYQKLICKYLYYEDLNFYNTCIRVEHKPRS